MDKYCKNRFPGYVMIHIFEFSTWKRMTHVQMIIKDHFCWKVRKGVVFFWEDDWAGMGILKDQALLNVDNTELLQDFGNNNNLLLDKLT